MIEVRQITPEDMPMLKGWAERRGCVLLEPLLSPHGFLAEADGVPILCAWAALLMSAPIVQVDHVYTARRFKREDAREAWDSLIDAVKAWVQAINKEGGFGYSLIEIVMNPAMQAEVERHGGQVSASNYKKAHYAI